MLNDHQQI